MTHEKLDNHNYPDNLPDNLPDADLQTLFAGVQPAVGFEDRLVNAVRQQSIQQPKPHRLRMMIPRSVPPAVRRAAIAAAAVLAVGSIGYFGSQAMNGQLRLPEWTAAERYTAQKNSVNTELDQRILQDVATPAQTQPPESVSQLGGADTRSHQEAKRWDYGSGSASESKFDIRKKNPEANLGQAVLYGDGHNEWMNNPFAGSQHDNVYTGRPNTGSSVPFVSGGTISKGTTGSSPYDNLDSILLPREANGPDQKTDAAKRIAIFANNSTLTGHALDAEAQVGSGGIDVNVTASRSVSSESETSVTTGNLAGLNYFHGNSEQNVGIGNGRSKVDKMGPVAETAQLSAVPPDEKPIPYGDIIRYSPAWPKTSEMRDPHKTTVFKDFLDPVTPVPPNAQPNTNNPGVSPSGVPAGVSAPTTAPAIDDRKIIRTGTMEFDVDRFDTAQMQITKIVLELGGFVGATDSQKLPNGKVRGSISVRVPPERLDVLVLSLRALGDLKAQQITAADITKEYTDVQSELAADRAMQDRLLELIHDGKGSVKDLLAAENELGEWRTKIEKAEGMIRYYNGQVALSTLSITLTERDIQTPATAVETETADVGIEAEDVEKARNSALKAVDDVKGRIVEAELKRFDAGQLAARLVADVPPESAGAVIDQLKQLGKVARLEIHRQETNTNGEATANAVTAGAAPLHTERKPTRLLISIYNLANVAPRRTTNVSLAAADVEAAYAALVTATKNNGGRVVTSSLDRGDPNKATGALVLEFPPDKLDSAITTLHAQGEVLNLNLTENPDTQNSTDAKTGLTVKLISLANIAPRHTTNVALATGDVNAAYAALIAVAKTNGGRVVTSTLEQGDPLKASGALALELPPEKFDAAMTTLHAQGDVLKLSLIENGDTQNSTEAKQGLTVRLIALAAVAPREVVQQTLAAPDVPTAYQGILSAASTTKARVQSASLNEQDRQNITADLQVEVPRATLADFDKALASAGGTIARTSARSADAENTVDSKVQLKLSIISADHLAPRETTKLQVEVSDVDKCANDAQAAVIAAGGRVLDSNITRDHGKGIARIILDFPLDKSPDLLNQIRSAGTVRGIDASRDPQAPTGPLAHGQIYVEFRTTEAIVADQTGPWASVRQGLSTSINGLLWSLQWVVVGLCLIGPWAGIGWIGWKLWKRKAVAKPSV